MDLSRRANMCNLGDPYTCFISLEPINDINDVAYAYHSGVGSSVPINKKYNTPEVRKQWMAKEKENMINGAAEAERMIPELAGLAVDLIKRTFPTT